MQILNDTKIKALTYPMQILNDTESDQSIIIVVR